MDHPSPHPEQTNHNPLARLLPWYQEQGKSYPWQKADAYGVWISEIMLQQTVVSVVVPRYKEWMDRFPEVASLAKIDEEQVLRAWEGLGYYSRARNIHRGAKVLTQDGHSQPPNDLVYLRSLPGIGEYTAAAILSFAYGRPEPVFDANVRRLLARLSASDSKTDQDLWREYYLALLGNHPPEVVNAALMQFGQLVCQSKNPSCLLCPLVDLCQAYQRDCVGDFPKKNAKNHD